ncbi:GlxA family transcriptional regulator [Xinfangfangia sp. CPCC 101601]|uniref:GlxA family transcriptional regulator n=1 Tax=Pseudogemmobacter lacusdianii TaxID=3069608 RepID=A0ABU0W281_9RHOB|nr:GlxA family transcriptional regulator [Xinfangfangia sp. CPCC 101601]MDQ2067888.1 GlxA family transcriptional regulator [Xinfangfangia sp. CPCC 101601]
MLFERATEPLSFLFLMTDDLSMMSLASAIEPLRAANRLLGREAFRWRLASIDGRPVLASSDIPFPGEPVTEALEQAHALFICGGMRVSPMREKPYLAALRRAAYKGIPIGALSTASYLLARAGLLDGYRATIHWENRIAFEEDFPNVTATGTLFEIDRKRLTCSGGTAAMDLMLHIVGERYGRDLARAVANQFHHERIRDSNENQQGGRLQQMAALPLPTQKVVRLMQNNIETPMHVEDMAEMSGISPRQLERQFRQHLGTTPTRYYISLRIEHARELLLYTEQPIFEVAIASGFSSASHFSRWFREFYHIRPTKLRERARTQQATPPPALAD